MRILKMRASFGKLNGELALQEGLNLLCMPNESGKSTWSAFLLAMLYGIDTREKASALNSYLPTKERYKPWDGRSMEGTIELEWQGRKITIERRTQGRVPMGDFQAYDTVSGTPIPELTAENCGLLLCGVERSVFERTAFIRQLSVAVSEDHELEKRLNTLVTTGEEGRSASEVAQTLHEMKVKLARAKTGRIAQLTQQIDEITSVQHKLHSMQDEAMQLRAQVDATEAELARLNALLMRIEQAEQAKKHLALAQMEQKLQSQEAQHASLQAQCAALPPPTQLYTLRSQFDEASSRLQTAQLENAFAPEAPKKPQPPRCFLGLDLSQAKKQQAEDAAKFTEYSNAKAPSKLPLLLSALLLLIGATILAFSTPIGIVLLALGGICVGISFAAYSRKSKKYQQARHHCERILDRYAVSSIDQTELLLAEYEEQTHSYEQMLSAHENGRNARTLRLSAAKNELDIIVRQIQCFAPDCPDASGARQAIASALQIHSELSSQTRSIELQRSQLLSMRQLLGDLPAQAADSEALTFDAAKLQYEKNAAALQLSRLQERLAEQNGRICATADAALLQAQLEQARAQLSKAKELYAQVCLAEEVLQRADETLRSRFSPQITAEAGGILAELTDHKYPHLLLKPDMTLSVREAKDIVMHPAAAMSCGTADQMYLALRLAMVRRLLGSAPILLDDALVNFDDARTAAAIRLLKEEAKTRQIILFTCKEIS